MRIAGNEGPRVWSVALCCLMNSVTSSTAILEFDRFQIIADRRELLAGGRVVELGAREFDLLLVLVEARGSVVSKDELIMRVWPGRVVEEGNLQTAIWALSARLC